MSDPIVSEAWAIVEPRGKNNDLTVILDTIASTRGAAWRHFVDRALPPGAVRDRDHWRRRGHRAVRVLVHQPDTRCRL